MKMAHFKNSKWQSSAILKNQYIAISW